MARQTVIWQGRDGGSVKQQPLIRFIASVIR